MLLAFGFLAVFTETKRISGEEYFRYKEIEAYVDPTMDRFLDL